MAYRKPPTSNIKKQDWNVIDDRSGFKLRASKAVVDSEGRVTSKDNYDEPERNRRPVVPDITKPLQGPFTDIVPPKRLQEGAGCTLDYIGRWDTIDINWDCLLNTWD